MVLSYRICGHHSNSLLSSKVKIRGPVSDLRVRFYVICCFSWWCVSCWLMIDCGAMCILVTGAFSVYRKCGKDRLVNDGQTLDFNVPPFIVILAVLTRKSVL